jgi:RNA polymerase sigma-70 factor (ECF subfamily)
VNASYLWRVAYSATIDEIRRARVRREAEQRAAEQPQAEAPRADQGARRRELARAIVGCLETLVEARQVAVTMHLQGHSVPESARMLGWEAKRVENLVYRGLADLRECLDGKGFSP